MTSQLRNLAHAHERRIAAAVAAHQGGRLAAWTRAQHAHPDSELVALLCGPLLIVILTKCGVPVREAWQLSQRAQALADDGELTTLEELLRAHGVDLRDDLLSVAVAGIAVKARAWVKRWGMRSYVADVSWVDASEEEEHGENDFGENDDEDGGGESEPRARTNGGASTTPSAAPATAAAAAAQASPTASSMLRMTNRPVRPVRLRPTTVRLLPTQIPSTTFRRRPARALPTGWLPGLSPAPLRGCGGLDERKETTR
ncbi:hypothetical protein [Microbacterium sp. NPDC055683]